MTKIERIWKDVKVYRRDDISPKSVRFHYFTKDHSAFGSITIIKNDLEIGYEPTKAEIRNESRKADLFNLLNDKWREWKKGGEKEWMTKRN